MKMWWEKIKEHPIASKVVAGLILTALLAIFNKVFSLGIFSSIIVFFGSQYVITLWLLLLMEVTIIILLVVCFKKSKFMKFGAPTARRVIRPYEQKHQYLIENNIARHIPDPETFEYLGQLYMFDWDDSERVTHEYFKKNFLKESPLPSILPHCRAYHEKMTIRKIP